MMAQVVVFVQDGAVNAFICRHQPCPFALIICWLSSHPGEIASLHIVIIEYMSTGFEVKDRLSKARLLCPSTSCKLGAPVVGNPVTAKVPRMGRYSGLSGPTTPKMGFWFISSNMEPTYSSRIMIIFCADVATYSGTEHLAEQL
jgi:hypothetical protein